jgi:ribokinase
MNRLLVLGNAGIDLLCPVPHLPRAGETVVAFGQSRAPGGKGLNQAVVAARAGAAVTFVAPVGTDDAAVELRVALSGERFFRLSLLPYPVPTDLSLLMVAPDAENCILSLGAAADALTIGDAEAAASDLGPGDVLLLQGNLSLNATIAAARHAAGQGATVFFNPAPLRWDVVGLLPLCAIVIANAGEANAITGKDGAAGAQALHAAGAVIAIVTLGAGGCIVADSGGTRHHPAQPVQAIDTTGAGDTFCGVLAALLLTGKDIDIAVPVAQRAAGLVVCRPGAFAALPSVAEFADLLAVVTE